MTPFEKLQEQLQATGLYIQDLLNFPLGKLFLAILGVWWSWFSASAIEWKLLAWAPVLWGMDFASGTALAIYQRKWTFRDMVAGLYRGGAWMMILFLSYSLSQILGHPIIFQVMLISVDLTEAASICDNIISAFPESEITLALRSLLRLIRRSYRKATKSLDAFNAEEGDEPSIGIATKE